MCTPIQQNKQTSEIKSEWLQNIFAQAIKSKRSSPRITFLRIFKLINSVKALFGKLTFLCFTAFTLTSKVTLFSAVNLKFSEKAKKPI